MIEHAADNSQAQSAGATQLIGSEYISSRRKRALDLTLAFGGLLLLLLLMPVLALIIKATSRGPVLYSRRRVGRDGAPFNMVKLRTMRVGSDASASGLRTQGRRDPRITGVGRFLRAAYLDELPQFWNVMRGHMSAVGPRPEYPELVGRLEALEPDFRLREAAKPGITGLAQLQYEHATGDEAAARRFIYDRRYIAECSLRGDIGIVARTLGRVFMRGGV